MDVTCGVKMGPTSRNEASSSDTSLLFRVLKMSSLDYNIIAYLEAKLETNPELAGAISILEKELGVSCASPDNFLNLGIFPTGLDEVFSAGQSKLDLITPAEQLARAQANGQFEAFVDAVRKKGFYKDVEVGSVEYLKRQAKLVKKFHEKSKPAVPDTKAQEEEAEAKKTLGNTAMTQ